MIRRVGGPVPEVRIADAAFPSPFETGLEYSAPARGTWNIVHTGMLIPEAHEIFVCAEGCLRGVVLTAAEMGAADRMSTVAIRQNNVTDGDLEDMLVEGVTDILEKLPTLPPAVLVYTSCIHHFMGADLGYFYDILRRRFPSVAFTDCYMTPILRKSGLTPDQLMRRQLYSLLEPCGHDEKTVLVAGNDFPTDEDSELWTLLASGGYTLAEIPRTATFAQYRELARASVCLTNQPPAVVAGVYLQKNHGMRHLHLPFSFDADEIAANYAALASSLGLPMPNFSENIAAGEAALDEAHGVIGDAPVAIDYTAFTRPLSLARLLLKHGFRVTRIYADGFTGEERADFDRLREEAPDMLLSPTVHPAMRVAQRETTEKTLAIGQKAAYFTGSPYFVNLVENGGFWGFEAIPKLADFMIDAWRKPKDTKNLIGIKGWGCGTCL